MSKDLMKQQPKFSAMITTKGYQDMIANTLRDPVRQKNFVANFTAAVVNNPTLATCTPSSILACGLLGESMNLAPSPQFGQYYMIPFKCKVKDKNGKVIQQNGQDLHEHKAQFVIGYKGYIQLAMRSGQYRMMNVLELKAGEFHGFNRMEEELIDYTPINDFDEWEQAETVAYYAFFEYLNGFRKAICWTKEQMLAHADRNSPAFSRQAYGKLQRGEIPDRDLWRYSSFWYKNFDTMAKKTMLRQLISRWGIMSTEMQTALVNDNMIANINEEKTDIVVESENALDAPVEPEALEAPEVVEQAQAGQVRAAPSGGAISLADL